MPASKPGPRLFAEEAEDSRTGRLIDRLASRMTRRRATRGDLKLDRRRVYILPTRAGLLFAGAMVTMLLATINYSLALGYVLTFVLAAVGLVSMLHTWRNLAGLILRPGRADAVHVGQFADMNLTLVNPSRQIRYAVQIQVPGAATPVLSDLPADAEKMISVALATRERGWLAAPRFKISTTFPLGLWRAWAYWQPAAAVLVLPQPETPAAPLPISQMGDGSSDHTRMGDDDISAIRPYRQGDSLRRLAWKAMARSVSGEPLTKEFSGGAGGEMAFDWQLLPAGMPVEARLSRLTRWVLTAEGNGQRFALLLPGMTLATDGGPLHREQCLEALALYDLPSPDDGARG